MLRFSKILFEKLLQRMADKRKAAIRLSNKFFVASFLIKQTDLKNLQFFT